MCLYLRCRCCCCCSCVHVCQALCVSRTGCPFWPGTALPTVLSCAVCDANTSCLHTSEDSAHACSSSAPYTHACACTHTHTHTLNTHTHTSRSLLSKPGCHESPELGAPFQAVQQPSWWRPYRGFWAPDTGAERHPGQQQGV